MKERKGDCGFAPSLGLRAALRSVGVMMMVMVTMMVVVMMTMTMMRMTMKMTRMTMKMMMI